MNVEIAICTFNRCRQLRNTLNRIGNVDQAGCESLRLIVVDNNSTDSTQDVIAEFANSLDILMLQESQQGHVFARNTAIAAATGDLLIWIDDDVVVSDYWLASYTAAAAEQTEVTFWGGPIVPVFEQAAPRWITDNWDKVCGCFAERKLGPAELRFDHNVLPYGANFALRTNAQKQFLFETHVGRTNRQIVGEDELILMRALLAAGHRGQWLPRASVEHMIEPSRATTEYVSAYFRGQGRALVLKNEPWTDDRNELKREMNHELMCYRAKRYLSKSEVWLSHLLRGSLAAGQLEALEAD